MDRIFFIAAAAILSLSATDSLADIASSDNCDSYWNGKLYGSGTNCSWRITDDGVLIIKGTGENASVGNDHSRPVTWGNYLNDINAVVVDNVSVPGNYGFYYGTFGKAGGYDPSLIYVATINGGTIEENALARFNSYNPGKYAQCTGNDVNACLVEKGLSRNCGTGKFLQEKTCVSSCGESFKLNDGECDRIRYTPAEAAQVLQDTDNEIIMTFKVNR